MVPELLESLERPLNSSKKFPNLITRKWDYLVSWAPIGGGTVWKWQKFMFISYDAPDRRYAAQKETKANPQMRIIHHPPAITRALECSPRIIRAMRFLFYISCSKDKFLFIFLEKNLFNSRWQKHSQVQNLISNSQFISNGSKISAISGSAFNCFWTKLCIRSRLFHGSQSDSFFFMVWNRIKSRKGC